MKKIVKPVIIISIICLLFMAGALIYRYSFKIYSVKSAIDGSVSGDAWSANVGWISFSGSGYGVRVDGNNGKFSGYAYSSNIGWITFNENELTGCPQTPCRAEAVAPGQLGKSDVGVRGWARALAYGGGWDGWIRFNHGQSDEVYISANGEFHGWAWGGSVVGWISFNCADGSQTYPFTCSSEGGDICQSNEYCPGKLLNVADSDSCCDITCALKTCAAQSGDICQSNETCPGTIIPASDTANCCSIRCVLKTCAELGGTICRIYEFCTGETVRARDTNRCCLGDCESWW